MKKTSLFVACLLTASVSFATPALQRDTIKQTKHKHKTVKNDSSSVKTTPAATNKGNSNGTRQGTVSGPNPPLSGGSGHPPKV